MQSIKTDIREELKNRMAAIQREVDNLKEQKDKIEWKLQDVVSKLAALRIVYETESERLGEPDLPLFTKKGTSYRFAGMRLTDALALVKKEQGGITKKKARQILEKEGFDFRGKRPGTAVHLAWVILERKERRSKE